MGQDWEYFTHDELKCKCGCEDAPMRDDFMNMLIAIREEFDRPIIITSAFRCVTHNNNIGGAKDSPHLHGKAVDVGVSYEDAYDLLGIALQHGMTGIGVKQKGLASGRFIHLDNMMSAKGRPRPTVWSY
jgi:zinc D-Ala-D-Ala carboxypeptidase